MTRRSLWVAGAVGLVLCVFWWTQITVATVQSDSVATLQLGENLAHHGVLSIDERPPIQPSMYREPVPGIIAGALIAIADVVYGPAAQSEYLGGERARFIKRQNIVWFLLLCVGCVVAVAWMARSIYAGLIAALLSQAFFFYPAARAFGIDTLFSDVPAAAILVVGSLLWARALQTASWRLSAAVGLVFGILTLVKAAMLYVFAGLACVAAGYFLVRRVASSGRALRSLLAMVVCFAAVVGPWLWRNHALFGVAAVADRGGLSLYTRAIKDQISDAEYRGSFYAWTPSVLRPWVGRVTGHTAADLQPGGVLQHFAHARAPSPEHDRDQAAEQAGRPDDALAYYVKGRAERVRQWQFFSAQGHPHPWLAADQALQRQALQYMRDHPWQHLKLALPMMWRGALVIFPLLATALVFALWRGRDELLLFCTPAFGLIMFYALFANFEERYGTPALPVALSSGIIVFHELWNRARRALTRTGD